MSLLKVDDLGRLLHVEYDYDYRDNSGKQVSIKQGDQYILIKKSNVDWWQVIKLDQKKPFYIPASYVKELPEKKMPHDHAYFNKAFRTLQKQTTKNKASLDDDAVSVTSSVSQQQAPPPKERTIYLTRSRDDLNVVSMTGDNSKVHVTRASTDSLERFIESENPYDEVPLQVDIDHQSRKQNKPKLGADCEAAYSEPEYENLDVIRKTDSANHQHQHHQASPPTVATSKTATKPTKKRQSSLSLSPTRLSATDDHHLSTSPSTMSTFKPTTPTFHSQSPPAAMATNHAEDEWREGWEVMADQQTGNSYLYNPRTGEMRCNDNTAAATGGGSSSKKHKKKKKPPPPLPDVSKKPTNSRKTLSPPVSTSGGGLSSSSGLQRRLSSPARYRSRKNWPVARYRRNNDDTTTTTKDSVFHDSTNNSSGSPAVTRTRWAKSHRTSSSSSSAMSPVRLHLDPSSTHDQQWYQETSGDDDSTVVFVNNITGERWQQMLDDRSQQFYYFNEQSRETAWSLPESEHQHQQHPQAEQYDVEEDDDHNQLRPSVPSNMKKSFTLERDMDVRLVQPAPRLRVPLKKDEGATGEGSESKYTKSLDRNLHVRSMIILRDGEDHRPADYAQSKQAGSAKASDHHSFITEARIQRQGRLNWTKLYEAGKKQRKNWTQQWVVLLANNLLFYKDHKQANPSKTFLNSKPESSCDLRGASIEHAASDRSSKKNVLELGTVRGLRLLLQHDDAEQTEGWLDHIRRTINTANQNDPIESGEGFGAGGTRSPEHHHDHDHHDDHDAPPSSSSSSKNKKKKDKKKSKAPSRHGSDAKNSDKVRNKLKKFIGKRPTFESLQERGIIKDAVFGCPLQKLCEKEQNNVPSFIQLCVNEVERRGLDVDGIYRVSGNLSHVQRLRYLIDRDETPDLSQPEWEDIHLITGALKMFLRELPQPVIPFEFFDKFIAACKIQVEDQRIKAMKDLVSCLPTHNKHTLKYLLQHFTRVVEHSSRNRMQVQNMAIVFGPTLLLKPPDSNPTSASGGEMAMYMVYQNQIIDTLLTEFNNIFTF